METKRACGRGERTDGRRRRHGEKLETNTHLPVGFLALDLQDLAIRYLEDGDGLSGTPAIPDGHHAALQGDEACPHAAGDLPRHDGWMGG